MTKSALKEILLRAKSKLEEQITEDRLSVLCEADLQFHLFQILRELMPMKIEIPDHEGKKLSVRRIYAEYNLEEGICPDIVVVDPVRALEHPPHGTAANIHSYLWSLPLQGVIELKYRALGDGRSLKNRMQGDAKKLKTSKKLADQNPLIWLVGYDQIENQFQWTLCDFAEL